MTDALAILLAIAVSNLALVFAINDLRAHRNVLALPGFLIVSVVFVNAGFLYLFATGTRPSWAVDGMVATSLGLLAALVGGALSRGGAPPTIRSGPAIRSASRNAYPAATVVALAVIAAAALPYMLRGSVPIVSGIGILLTDGITTGLVNSFRISQDVYVNPDVQYVPLQGLMDAFRYFGLPVVIVWFLDYARRGEHRFLSWVIVLTCLALLIGTGQRWPLLFSLVAVLIYALHEARDADQVRRAVGRIALFGVVIGIALSTLLGRAAHADGDAISSIVAGAWDLVGRVVTGNAVVPFESYRVFPSQYSHLSGASWVQNLAAYLPGQGASFPVTFSQQVTGDPKGFTAPPDFYTEAFINFGWAGVLVISAAWGAMLGRLDSILLRGMDQKPWQAFLAVLASLLAFSAITGATFMLSGIIVGIPITLAAMALTALLRGEPAAVVAQPPRGRGSAAEP